MANALYGRYEANKPLVYSRGSEAMVFAPAQFWPTYWLAKERFPLELAFRIVRDVTGKEARAILTKFGLFKTDWQVKNFTGADCIKVLRLRIQHEKVKVYKISSDEMFSVYSGDSYLSMNCKSALTLQDPNQQGVKAFREKLAIELSTLLMHRRSDKIRKDDAYWSEGVVTRFLIVTGSVIYVFGESIAALVKLAFNVIYSIAKAIHYTVQQALKTLGDLATGDFEAVQRDIQRLVGGVVQGIETMAASLARGYDIVKTIWSDDHSKKLLLAFMKEYVDGTSVVDAATFGIMLTIDVILIIGTLGAGAVVVGARLAQRVGQFTVRALQFIVDLYRALKLSRTMRRTTQTALNTKRKAIPAPRMETSTGKPEVPSGKDEPYNSKLIRHDLEQKYGKENVVSTTVPPTSKPNVKLAGQHKDIVLKDGTPSRIVFDKKGYPIFDDAAKYETHIPIDKFRSSSYSGQMKLGSQDLSQQIKSGKISSNQFTEAQLKAIHAGNAKIPDYTWHHHQDTGRMQLVPTDVHEGARHVGWESMHKGQ